MAVVALTTQNKRNVTEHAGKCRNFLVRDLANDSGASWQLRSIAKDDTLSARKDGLPAQLQDVDVVITAGAGPGLQRRLQALGVELFVTDMLMPEHALADWLELAEARKAGLVPETHAMPAAGSGRRTASHDSHACAASHCGSAHAYDKEN